MMFSRLTATASRVSLRQVSTRALSTSTSRSLLLRPSANVGRTTAAVGRRWISTETKAAIQKAVDGSPVVLFMKGTPGAPECGFSRAVIQVLELHGVPKDKFRAYNVLEDSELRSGIKEFSEWPTIPQLYVNGEFVGGCDILLSMHQSGELEKLLEDKEIIERFPEPAAAETAPSA